ncbi:MAG: potassium-transporting ATPase subunit KdpC [Chloroflexi bacterium]|nr:MAG: potassium-transporting ATPase subunit KdpC [Chloroflexota bacterium]
MRDQIRSAVVMLILMTIITGLFYSLAVTAVAQALFPRPANGSLLWKSGVAVGSELIGQPFDSPRYFWGRPSATAPFPYNAAASSGSNLGPGNPALERVVRARIAALAGGPGKAADAGNRQCIPVDLVTASASGLDPDISLAAALYQVPRVARARSMGEADVEALVMEVVERRQLWVLGEPRVNVLNLNLALDRVQ